MAFTYYLQLFVMHVPKALNCAFAETEITHLMVMAPTTHQVEAATGDLEDGGTADAVVDLLEQQDHPAGVYSIMAVMEWRGGKSADTPSGPGEYWSSSEPVGDVTITRLDADDGVGQLSDFEVDDELMALLFPGQDAADTSDVQLLLKVPK